ncbi:MAG TPA: glycosyltransferase [Streptosporangiaceae bacterium]|jgi:glycosyltransferase involved in cell wall biosynthesis
MRRAHAAPGRWDDLIVVCAANSYDGARMADSHLAGHLARRVPVLYVDPPVSPLAPVRNPEAAAGLRGPRLRLAAPGIARLTPVVQPFPYRPGTASLTCAVTRGYLRRAAARLGGRVRAVISGWPQYPVFGSCREEVGVYWAHDDYVGGAELMGLNGKLLARTERRVAGRADLLLAANPLVADSWRSRGFRAGLIPFGADVDAYLAVDAAVRPADAQLPGPVAGFVGRINDRTDLSLLEAVAGQGCSLLLVGPKDAGFEPARFAALAGRPNVRWVGAKPSGELPGYLRLIDVGLVPYRDTPFNRGSFPLKTLEYLAAGRAVVATDLPAIRWLATDLISVARPADFAGQVAALLRTPRTPAITACRREFAARHSWARRAADMLAVIAAYQRQPDR